MMEQRIIRLLVQFVILSLFFTGISHEIFGQRYIARNGSIRFFSTAPLENIEAINNQGLSVVDISSGEIAFTIPITGFEFEKNLMQQHFNENYMESERFPNSTFKGKIFGFTDSSKDQPLKASGDLTIHGVTKNITVNGTGYFAEDKIILKASFPIKLADYKIKIPKVVFYNIAEVVDVSIEFEYAPY